MFIVDPLLWRTMMNRAVESPLEFTPKQGQYLAFIHAYTLVNGRPPAQADMQRFFRVTPPAVHQMLLTLEKAGLISRQPGCLAVSRSRSTVTSYPDCTHQTPNPSNPM
jgi:DNA-binding MarR family transcriptional regulator